MTRIAIIGLGLIGGSLGLALKKAKGDEVDIVGFARRPEIAAEAIKRGAVTRTEPEMGSAVAGVNIVVIATPLVPIKDILPQIAERLSPGTIVTDVGSTKAQVIAWAAEYLPSNVDFVGGHPMTGKETSGLADAEAGLFENCVYCLSPSRDADGEAIKTMEEMARWVGATPLLIDAEKHDALVAGISHLPLLLSSSLVSALAKSDLWPEMSKLAATGFLDMTRLAGGDTELYRGICATNQKAILDWIDRYIDTLNEYRELVLQDEKGLQSILQDAREIRQEWFEKEGRRFRKQGD
ncbi:MAG: prephenate dehydrogenase [Chloroflexi bacterium]|jgi:prephenate dehydrogenase|nr:prephenate dehydrogenase [Chloroflexota bacterium]